MNDASGRSAPGWPGIPARWTSSAKTGVGTAASRESRVWFTLSHGILNEIYYPRIDCACIRDLEFLVTDGQSWLSEEKRHTDSDTSEVATGIPAFRIRNTAHDGRYRLEKDVIADPRRDVLLQRVRLVPLTGSIADLRLYVLVAPHLANRGGGNTAWVGDYKGHPMLFAERDRHALALGSTVPWVARSVGFVGVSDGWQELTARMGLRQTYTRAEDGNVAVIGQIDLRASQGHFVLALGFGPTAVEAAQSALTSLLDDFDQLQAAYVGGWRAWHAHLERRVPSAGASRLYRTSATVLRTHESKRIEGGIIASLSIPWGFSKPDDDLGGYHLVWPRDLVEAAGGLIAIGAHESVARVLRYLETTQEPDGHWSQNMWLDGTPYWHGTQMDETALPILLVDLACRKGVFGLGDRQRLWPMVRRAAGFLVRNGPGSPQDRWEEEPGYSPFTVAAEIAALVVAAEMAQVAGETAVAAYLLETADVWNDSIERWLYVEGTDLARRHAVEGCYIRVAAPPRMNAASPRLGFVPIKLPPPGPSGDPTVLGASPDALALVRFGLRAPDDARIQNTVTVIDGALRVETPRGPVWRRYEGDSYGEHADGTPFDGTGIGRGWPLLTGERAHFELAAGRVGTARRLAEAMEALAGEAGLLPEQVWDRPDLADHELRLGHPTGSASPLVWAHAEYVKLCRSLRDGEVFDRPPQTVERYLVRSVTSCRTIWRFNQRIRTLPVGAALRIETLASAVVHWSADGWRTSHDTPSRDTGLEVHVVDLDTCHLEPGSQVIFTFFWPEAGRWEGEDFAVRLA
ncbi:MAG: glucan 1,4-alpha-glucosidase [Vicinamibacterales bacterium]